MSIGHDQTIFFYVFVWPGYRQHYPFMNDFSFFHFEVFLPRPHVSSVRFRIIKTYFTHSIFDSFTCMLLRFFEEAQIDILQVCTTSLGWICLNNADIAMDIM